MGQGCNITQAHLWNTEKRLIEDWGNNCTKKITDHALVFMLHV